MRLCQRW